MKRIVVGLVAVLSTFACGYRAGAIHPGTSAKRLAHHSRSLGHGLWLGRRLRHGARFVYRVRGGRVRWVAVASRTEARRARALRRDLRAAGLR